MNRPNTPLRFRPGMVLGIVAVLACVLVMAAWAINSALFGISSGGADIQFEEGLDIGIVDKQMPNARLEIPVGYFYHQHGGREGWDAPKRRRSRGSEVTIMATTEGLLPYSEQTREIFNAYTAGTSRGRVLIIGIADRKARQERSNREYFSMFLHESMRTESEYEGLEKYVKNATHGRFVYLNGMKDGDYAHYTCFVDDVSNCAARDCRGDFCFDYYLYMDRMDEWKIINEGIWELVESFRVRD